MNFCNESLAAWDSDGDASCRMRIYVVRSQTARNGYQGPSSLTSPFSDDSCFREGWTWPEFRLIDVEVLENRDSKAFLENIQPFNSNCSSLDQYSQSMLHSDILWDITFYVGPTSESVHAHTAAFCFSSSSPVDWYDEMLLKSPFSRCLLPSSSLAIFCIVGNPGSTTFDLGGLCCGSASL